ncbi:MAG: metal ABC transporter ATP-binding protein [Lachnospiraceae bacterium]
MALLEANNLALGYDGNIVTEGIQFQLEKGNYLCIVGENGAGKSTLMKTILGLMKPVSGTITYKEKNGIGYLPQQTVVQKDFPASVWEIVLSGCLSKCGRRSFYNHKDKELAKENLNKLNIWDLRNKSYRNLSGGQQQRVLLARALCAASEILLLDEPVSGLDPKVTVELYQIIQELNKQGLTIIMISHDISAAVNYASQILHLGKKQLFYGTKNDYKESVAWKVFKAEGELADE